MIDIHLPADITHDRASLIAWRQHIDVQLDATLAAGESIRQVIYLKSQATDQLLMYLWHYYQLPATDLALIAVGGYGRAEMLPLSDVDVMILSKHPLDKPLEERVSQFITNLWDIGLAPGVSVRSIDECLAAASDITVATSLVESRVIVGDAHLGNIPRQIVVNRWSDRDFFDGKMQEQKQRYAKHHNTEYNLEPDVKNAPGGIRDINQIGWIAKRHFRVGRYYDLVHLGFITEFEFKELQGCEEFLWTVRYHLHRVSNRNDNRLLFDYQRDIAERLGFTQSESDHRNAAIESFMKSYYRVAMKVSTLNEMLLAYFYESFIESRLPEKDQPKHIDINERFELIGNQIAAKSHRVFAENPSSILEIFQLMAQQTSIVGIRAKTLRILILAAKSIDSTFRDNPAHRAQFMAIIYGSTGLFNIFKDMKRYGVLGQYLPAFGQIIGLMQYDLFHIYTVDAHTLVVLRNLQRFAKAKYADDFPVVSAVFNRMQHKHIVYLAALFHDIAKGRGGDHSQLGAEDAIAFCLCHGLTQREANIVAWLTRNHLLMSLTAQKQDIADPDVLENFARLVGDDAHLDFLYTLTVADINATNPTLWNSWRASLLKQLYIQTRRLFRMGLETPIDRQALIDENKAKALQLLTSTCTQHAVEKIWIDFSDDYFLKEQPSEIAWHTTAIFKHGSNPNPLVLLREYRIQAMDAIEIFIYTKDLPNLFAATVATIDQLNLNVQDARIIGNTKNYSLDTYVVLDDQGTLLTDSNRQAEVLSAISNVLSKPEEFPTLVQRRMPRHLKHFLIPTEVSIILSPAKTHHVVEVMTLDRPGLLARIGYFFVAHGINISSAKIATLGERAEDVFFVNHHDGSLLSQAEADALAKVLTDALDESQPAALAGNNTTSTMKAITF